MKIEARGLTKRFGTVTALHNVDLDVGEGELVALLGPSGCGKTTLLRVLAGLESADAGTLRLGDEEISERAAGERGVGFVFQHYALFRHMTVAKNIGFGLSVRRRDRLSRAEIARRVDALLALVRMEGLGGRYPEQLSGGQRQRVALARALAVEPRVLLLDEPFGALDAGVRRELRRWLRRLHDDLRVTSLFVTHDVEEALEVADRVVVMHAGRVEQTGTPDEVYEHPASPFVYRFLGSVNLFRARREQGALLIAGGAADDGAPALLTAYARPHDVEIAREPGPDPTVVAEVVRFQAVGPIVRVELRRCDDGAFLDAELSRERFQEIGLRAGERVRVRPRRLHVFGT